MPYDRFLRCVWILRHDVDPLLLLQALLFAVAVPLLARLKLTKLQSLLGGKPTAREPAPASIQKIVRSVDVALRAGGSLVRRNCLTRGLTRYYFLRRAGVEIELCFGAGFPEANFAAHCWLVRNGEPFLEPSDPRASYTEIYSFPRGPASARVRQVSGHRADGPA